jgi:hypothetical protein
MQPSASDRRRDSGGISLPHGRNGTPKKRRTQCLFRFRFLPFRLAQVVVSSVVIGLSRLLSVRWSTADLRDSPSRSDLRQSPMAETGRTRLCETLCERPKPRQKPRRRLRIVKWSWVRLVL